ncbi:MAG: NAD(P)-dependent alcohol dehydrogenase [Candidatus Marinimicrobia bacterium]|nr:NAD(P)-dependent alcohol dehydrogenase [Candidatus Neomarinimicrobiota bacterium]
MKAIVYTKYGPPDVLQLKEVAKPTLKDSEVLIKIYATTVNRTDCGFLRAKPFIVRFFSGLIKPRNTILGNEFSGKIEAVGKDVMSFKVGDKVFGYNGDDFGAHAEYMTMPEEGSLTTMPENLTYEEVVPSTEGVHYAYSDIKAANIQKGQKVLINGATGAIGSAAVQLVKNIGAEVTAVSNTKNVDLVKSLGADKVVDYEKEDFTKDDQTYDVVFDAVGKSSFAKCKSLLKPRGIYLSTELGYMSQNIFLALITPLFGKKKVLFPIPTINKKDIIFFKKLIEAGNLKPVIDRCYPLEQIVEAYKYVEKGQKTGNVVITLEHTNEI